MCLEFCSNAAILRSLCAFSAMKKLLNSNMAMAGIRIVAPDDAVLGFMFFTHLSKIKFKDNESLTKIADWVTNLLVPFELNSKYFNDVAGMKFESIVSHPRIKQMMLFHYVDIDWIIQNQNVIEQWSANHTDIYDRNLLQTYETMLLRDYGVVSTGTPKREFKLFALKIKSAISIKQAFIQRNAMLSQRMMYDQTKSH